jgi:hypothetical protein
VENTGINTPQDWEFRELPEEALNIPRELGSCMLSASVEHRQAGKESWKDRLAERITARQSRDSSFQINEALAAFTCHKCFVRIANFHR